MRTIDANSLPEFKIQNGIKVKKVGTEMVCLKSRPLNENTLSLSAIKINSFLVLWNFLHTKSNQSRKKLPWKKTFSSDHKKTVKI